MSQRCTEVTPQCPVELTTYGYRPVLSGNIVFIVIFGLCTIAQTYLGLRHKLRAFTFAVSLGCLGETIGYGGRVMMNDNPWSGTGFKIQIVCIILAPSFLAAGFYLTLKHLILYIGPEHSRLKPKLYTWIFICADALSIITQAVGGGIASAETRELVDVGNGIIIAGIVIQVVTQFICICLGVDFALRVKKRGGDGIRTWSAGFIFYIFSSCFAFLTIFIRCVYRIPEMSGGWGNDLMRKENEFLILDGMMIAIACILLTVAHPGIFFPNISSRRSKAMEKQQQQNDQESSNDSDGKEQSV
ncbi:RTA1-domain-containing protein [Hortaea werneckii]|nr:RTA1-domain-containing protein [Hortaea werneckii]